MHALKLIESLGENWIADQQARANSISSYEISCISGLDKYTSALKLWAVKTGKTQPEPQSLAMWLALKMRPVLLKLFERQNGTELVEHNTMYHHPEFHFAACRPDAFIANNDDLNSIVKVTQASENTKKQWEDGIPEKFLLRAQWEMGVMGLETLDLGVLFGYEFQTHQCEFSPAIWDQSLQLAAKFLDCVERDVPPDAGPGDSKLIAKLTGNRIDKCTNLMENEKASELVDKIFEYKNKRGLLEDEVKELKEEQKRCENQLVQLLGQNSWGIARRAHTQAKITVKEIEVKPYPNPGYSFTRVTIK